MVDLDGTLVECNTLHVMLRLGLRHAPLVNRAAIAMLIVARRLRLISHETMKYKALALTGRSAAITDKFVVYVESHRSARVASILEERKKAGDRILLASAAASSYIPLIWDGEFLASPDGGPDLRGRSKVRAVEQWLDDNNLEIGMFITDHFHDLPLALATRNRGGEVVIVNPTPKSAKIFAENGFDVP